MLGLLCLQFRSLTEALIVLVSVPFALVGSFWTLYLLDYKLSAPVWVGLLSVVGLAMQTGVVMVVYIDDAFDRRVRARADPDRATTSSPPTPRGRCCGCAEDHDHRHHGRRPAPVAMGGRAPARRS